MTQSKIQRFYELLHEMTGRELKIRYKHTILGFLWMVLNPILQMLIIGFVFRFFMKEPVQNYYYYLLIGLLTWNFFSVSLSKSTPSIIYERSIIKKAKFPSSIIPLAIIFSNFIHLLTAMLILTIPILFLKTMSLDSLFSILAAYLLLLMFSVGISLFTSALNVRFRDVNFFVQAYLTFWFYATPIVYPLSIVPYQYYWLWRFNPLTSVLQLLQHGFLNMPPPGIAMILMNTTIIVVLLVTGIIVFKKESKNFDDWI
jgi:ABC-type polysaccharide/polyol phosphate export permease